MLAPLASNTPPAPGGARVDGIGAIVAVRSVTNINATRASSQVERCEWL